MKMKKKILENSRETRISLVSAHCQQSYSVQGKVDNKVNCTRAATDCTQLLGKAGQKPGGSRPTLVLKYTNFHHLLIHIINDLPFNIDQSQYISFQCLKEVTVLLCTLYRVFLGSQRKKQESVRQPHS